MTVVDRPDNGQDEGLITAAERAIAHSIAATYTVARSADRALLRGDIAQALAHQRTTLNSGRAGAGEQQRERLIEVMNRHGVPAVGNRAFFAELLALLGGPQPDGQAVAEARACWCAHCEGIVLAADHPTNWVARIGGRRFIVCRDCGDKRCPRAAHHDAPCAYREPCRVYSHGESGWHCAVTGEHDQHTNAAGTETW